MSPVCSPQVMQHIVSSSRAGLQQRQVVGAALALPRMQARPSIRSCACIPSGGGLTSVAARLCAAAAAHRSVHSAALPGEGVNYRTRPIQAGLIPGRPAHAPDRRLSVMSAKKISQQDFTEKAWQAVVAAPQVFHWQRILSHDGIISI